MADSRLSRCPGCGLELPEAGGPKHPHIGASPECWAVYGTVLARAYEDAAFGRLLQLVVDTYAVQHPGEPGRQSAQSVSIHLATLGLAIERGLDTEGGRRVHELLLQRGGPFRWLEPPGVEWKLTVADLAAAEDLAAHESVAWRWAREVWDAWVPHHGAARELVTTRLGD